MKKQISLSLKRSAIHRNVKEYETICEHMNNDKCDCDSKLLPDQSNEGDTSKSFTRIPSPVLASSLQESILEFRPDDNFDELIADVRDNLDTDEFVPVAHSTPNFSTCTCEAEEGDDCVCDSFKELNEKKTKKLKLT